MLVLAVWLGQRSDIKGKLSMLEPRSFSQTPWQIIRLTALPVTTTLILGSLDMLAAERAVMANVEVREVK